MPRVPHLTHPVRLGVDGRPVSVEQDTLADVASCLHVAASYRRGDLEAAPDFGLADPTFTQGGPDAGEIEEALERMEPRARIVVDADRAAWDELVHTVTVTMTPTAEG